MARRLAVAAESWPIKGAFRIARGAKTQAQVVVATISDGPFAGRGECVPYARYGETVQSVLAQIETIRPALEAGLTRETLQQILPAGAARNAVDCALIDLEAKNSGRRAFELLGLAAPVPVRTAYTLSLDEPEAMAKAAGQAAAEGYQLLKLKIAGAGDLARVEAVRAAAPSARLIVDANEGWTPDDLVSLTPMLRRLGVALIEQPLKADDDSVLLGFQTPVPLCADESCHTRADLPRITGRYSHINVKLDKTGGLTEAVGLVREARAQGLGLMIGCMVATSLAMAPASLLAGSAEFVDLDGPLLLAGDRTPAMRYERDLLHPPPPDLWG
jgi:L-alanine-DL-glutamate epimerase-like enolase superfamily enzyme